MGHWERWLDRRDSVAAARTCEVAIARMCGVVAAGTRGGVALAAKARGGRRRRAPMVVPAWARKLAVITVKMCSDAGKKEAREVQRIRKKKEINRT